MADSYYGGSAEPGRGGAGGRGGPGGRGGRGARFAQARRLVSQAGQDRTTGWYLPLVTTVIAAGASFEAFGRAFGLIYAVLLTGAFVALTWSTIRLMPSVSDQMNVSRVTAVQRITTVANTPVRTRGSYLMMAGLPVVIALIKTVGFFVLGGILIVGVIVGAAVAAAFVFERR
ncbi:hypothetical protein MXD61_16630 [Frankia sp. AgPm24]|uniref:Uncharacterized protein n=1 Tax=Frankia umida TaxID=573489 RepID=A0ABT0K3D9_9ACTN|nr:MULTISPECIES: hypothetical protein [Frankia]MCK9878318.1 hypothetical protein [Frankia umida]MCK9923474.1 hypothetical protein [Frankia sp. AgPm24]